ncbi:putative Polar-differentiation response regulator DivK [Georgfuchsia toluolica]|uniref:Polar-differentiation response regulator DivK n=1 Tax=Georgfuchsia toluolica TaxID=424218 RepID=A0A916J6I5_9PROT|nr:response regulator [Georgfuchsia toluolica]CAG4884085.1 putative Polar-differentiation response regulator DivK [Georgfuchsia toluolica]
MKKRILVVDDEPAITRMLVLILEQTGRYEVRSENSGRNAIALAREFRPDLMLLDVMMPGMLGSEIAEQLQADPELRAIKFVFLTAVVSKEEAQRSNGQIGGHTFIAKPISADDLCRTVEEHLG